MSRYACIRATEPTGKAPSTETEIRAPRAEARPPTREADPPLHAVRDAITLVDPDGSLMAAAIRATYDQLYDGQHTGRWDVRQLCKTEKTHMGTLVEINLQRFLGFADGDVLDYNVVGHEVDCKFSQALYGWSIPIEMYDPEPRIALLTWASDYKALWLAGLLRTEDSCLRTSRNRDGKRVVNDDGADRILWLRRRGDLPENILLRLPQAERDAINAPASGQRRVNELFARVQGRLIDRATILRVAQQDDPLKRVRDARAHLRSSGVVIFGHYQPHPGMAERLGLPAPHVGQFVSARLSQRLPGDDGPGIELGGTTWRLASGGDPVVDAPRLPSQNRES